ncbi:MAG: sigma-70 family RNA polymerase sigma factor [Spirochaetota bacterium]
MGIVIKNKQDSRTVDIHGACPELPKDLISSYKGLVTNIARHYTSTNCPFEDLMQEGYMGLLKAASRFDASLGCKYTTYATYWIKHYISRYVAKHDRLVRLPIKKNEMHRRILKMREILTRENGTEPTIAEIADYADSTEAEIKKILDIFQPEMSLEAPLGESTSDHYDVIQDTVNTTPERMFLSQEVRNEVERALDKLIKKERDIIKMRFGIGSGRQFTLKEIADSYNISSETVRQIEKRAIKKIREKSGFLKEFVTGTN